MKKKLLLSLMSVLVISACSNTEETTETTDSTEESQTEQTGQSDQEMSFTAGSYEGTAEGYAGPLTVNVELSDSKIESVEVTDHSETDGIGTNAIQQLPEHIVETQSTDVEAVSGATLSSEAIIEATESALEESGADIEAIRNSGGEITYDEVNETTNVVVIGGGGAGLSAAVSAAQEGSDVILIEKTAALGGNTIRAGGPLNAVDPERQQNLPAANEEAMQSVEALTEVEPLNEKHAQYMAELKSDLEEYYSGDADYLFDSEALHILQTYDGGDYEGDIDFIETLVQNGLETIEWLESNGVVWQDDIQTVPGGLWPRAHLPENAAGGDYIKANEELANELGVEIIFDATAEDLIIEDDRVVGVSGVRPDGTEFTIYGDQGVVLATGGFAANEEMRQEYDPSLTEDLGTTNSPVIVGDGIEMGEEVDTNLVGMEHIQSLPLGQPGEGGLEGWVGGLGVEYYYQINTDGVRFMAEDGRRDEMTDALLEQEDALSYVIAGSNPESDSGETIWGDNIDQLVEDGIVFRADTIEELAEQIDVPVENLVETHENFNQYVENSSDPDFDRELFGETIEAPFYASPRRPTVHHTMGGIQISQEGQAIDVNGNIIPGLYAAGEVTGGIHGTNRLGGNALLDIHVFGRAAGEKVASEEPVELNN